MQETFEARLAQRINRYLDGERPEHEIFDQEDVIAGKNSMTITIDQDIHYLRDMQAGMHSGSPSPPRSLQMYPSRQLLGSDRSHGSKHWPRLPSHRPPNLC